MRSVDRFLALGALVLLAASCDGTSPAVTGPSFQDNPCSTGTVDLASAQVTGVDCSNGGTTVTFAGNGASYLVVAQLATEQGSNSLIPYTMSTGTPLAASVSSPVAAAAWPAPGIGGGGPDIGLMRSGNPGVRQVEFEAAVLARGSRLVQSGAFARSVESAGRSEEHTSELQS